MAVLIGHSRVSYTRLETVEALRRQAEMVEGTDRRIRVYISYVEGYEHREHHLGHKELLDLADLLASTCEAKVAEGS